MKRTQHTHRDGNTLVLVTVETRPAVIDFADVYKATEVVPDELSYEAPWEHWDDWQHTATDLDDSRFDGVSRDSLRKAAGECWDEGNRRRVLIEQPYDSDLYKWYRDNGASRGVARQLVAKSMAKRLEQIVKWYRYGWEWWAVKGEYNGCYARVGGIDDDGYAEEMRREIAGELASELEDAGYTVINYPAPAEPAPKKAPGNVNLFNL
jgi:hypothetical protein